MGGHRPELVDEPVGRDGPAVLQEEQGKERSLATSAEPNACIAPGHLDRPEDPELQLGVDHGAFNTAR